MRIACTARGARGARVVLAAAGLVAGMLGATGIAAGTASAAPAAGATSAAAVAHPAHVTPPHIMTIMMENTDYSQFVGAAAMPYLNEIAHQYATFTDAFGWTYPSLPNYLELLSGSDDGTAGRDCDITDKNCSNFTNPTLVDQLEAAGIAWHAYYQGVPSGCYQGDGGGNYPYWHNAFRYFKEFAKQCSHISNFSDLLPDLNKANPAAFQWVVPDLVGSGGDNGTMQTGDSWLNGELPKIMASNWYRHGGQIVIIFDTGYNDAGGVNGSSGGQIPLVVVSARDKGRGQVKTPVNTAGVLRSIEHAYGLSYLADARDARNGTLGAALVSGRPAGSFGWRGPRPVSFGSVLAVSGGGTPRRLAVSGGTISINGVAEAPADPIPNRPFPVIEVGQNSTGHGAYVFAGRTHVVPGTANLLSVSCAAVAQCYAVGFGPLNSDEAVLVSIQFGHVVSVTQLPAFIGLFGISCPTAGTCYAVGYDNANDADAVTTIVNGVAGAPVEVAGGGEWLNAISCPTATDCFAAGLVNYNPSIVPIVSGTPGTALTVPDAWYLNGIFCPSDGNCVAAGENTTEQGIIAVLAGGKVGTPTVVPGTEYLYGAGCQSATSCVVAGAGTPGADGYSSGVLLTFNGSTAGAVVTVPHTNGFGQVLPYGKGYLTVGAAYLR